MVIDTSGTDLFNNNDADEVPEPMQSELIDGNNESSECYELPSNAKGDIVEMLANWALVYNISQSAVNALLCILIVFFPQLPKDSRSLLHTPKKISLIAETEDNVNPYWYDGVETALRNKFKNLSENVSLALNFNIDGLPIYKSLFYI